jgi:hypothetical protein
MQGKQITLHKNTDQGSTSILQTNFKGVVVMQLFIILVYVFSRQCVEISEGSSRKL